MGTLILWLVIGAILLFMFIKAPGKMFSAACLIGLYHLGNYSAFLGFAAIALIIWAGLKMGQKATSETKVLAIDHKEPD